MSDIVILLAACNGDLLYEQLAAGGFPSMTSIMSPSADPAKPFQVTVHFSDGTAQSAIDAAVAIVHAHDATQLSTAQQAAVAAQAAIITLDGELGAIGTRLTNFNATSFADVNALAGDLAVLVNAIRSLTP